MKEDEESYNQIVRRVLNKNHELKSKSLAKKIKEDGEKEIIRRHISQQIKMKQESVSKGIATHAEIRPKSNMYQKAAAEQYLDMNEDISVSDEESGYSLVHREDGFYHYDPIANIAAYIQCHNCQENHYVKDCSAPFCCQCKKRWGSVNENGYHNPLQCPYRPLNLKRKSTVRQSTLVQQKGHAARSGTRHYTNGTGPGVITELGKRRAEQSNGPVKRSAHVNFMPQANMVNFMNKNEEDQNSEVENLDLEQIS